MTQSSARTMPTRRQRSSQAARRRWLILFAVVAVVVVAFLVNIGPLTHYQDASARLQKATAKVDTLQTQKADLQGQLAKLSETGYLETLARQQLTYVRPGEELFIVTKPAGDTARRLPPGRRRWPPGRESGLELWAISGREPRPCRPRARTPPRPTAPRPTARSPPASSRECSRPSAACSKRAMPSTYAEDERRVYRANGGGARRAGRWRRRAARSRTRPGQATLARERP